MTIVHLRKGKRGQTLLLRSVDAATGQPISSALQSLLYFTGMLRLLKNTHMESLAVQLLIALAMAALGVGLRWILLAILLVPVARWVACVWGARRFEHKAFDTLMEERSHNGGYLPPEEGEEDGYS